MHQTFRAFHNGDECAVIGKAYNFPLYSVASRIFGLDIPKDPALSASAPKIFPFSLSYFNTLTFKAHRSS
jgi:hypothetical protein